MKQISADEWNKAREAMDFEMFIFRKMHGLKRLDFPDYFDAVFDAFIIEFGEINFEIHTEKQLRVDGMIELLIAKYLEDPGKEHLHPVMRLKLERELGM